MRNVSVQPTASADAMAPTRIAICWRRGVAPTRNPVFRSCEVLPPLATATAITQAIEIARTRSSICVQPSSRKMTEMAMSDAIVIPEIGFGELPIWPQMRDDTVVKRKPKMMISIPPSRFTPIDGRNASPSASSSEPKTVTVIGRSSSVRSLAATACPTRLALRSAKPARKAPTMVGSERASAMIPAVATAPAPM